jgi:aldehyde dehydrogenase (NAD+)
VTTPEAVIGDLRASFESGITVPIAWRKVQLGALEAMVNENAATLEGAIETDLGRPRAETFFAESGLVLREAAGLRRHLDAWARTESVRTPPLLWPGRSRIRHEPLGVVLVIGPWNYPINLVLVPLAAALAAGNCAVVKPSEMAPTTSATLAELIPRYLDARAVAVIEGGADVTEATIDAGVDHVFFTGSAPVGRLVMERAARHLTPVTLELGGKCPVIVDDSVDLGLAARRIVYGKFLNAGQSCIAPDYVLVQARVRDPLVSELVRATEELYGRVPGDSPDLARIVNARHLGRIAALLADHGGKVAYGGDVDEVRGRIAPTIVVEPDRESSIMHEEIFGPILPVLSVVDVDAAIAELAGKPIPLTLYLFSTRRAVIDAVVAGTRSGSVVVNATMLQFASSEIPFGGVGASGTGAYHGRFGFERLSQLRPVLERPQRAPMFSGPPFRRVSSRLVRTVLRRLLSLDRGRRS